MTPKMKGVSKGVRQGERLNRGSSRDYKWQLLGGTWRLALFSVTPDKDEPPSYNSDSSLDALVPGPSCPHGTTGWRRAGSHRPRRTAVRVPVASRTPCLSPGPALAAACPPRWLCRSAHKSLVAEAGPLGVCLRRAGTPGPERGGDSGSGEKPATSSEKVAGRCDHLSVGPRVVQARGRAPFTRRASRGPAAGRLRQSWITCWSLSSGCPQALGVKMLRSALGSSQCGGFSLLA